MFVFKLAFIKKEKIAEIYDPLSLNLTANLGGFESKTEDFSG